MKDILPGPGLKIADRSIYCFCKISDDPQFMQCFCDRTNERNIATSKKGASQTAQ